MNNLKSLLFLLPGVVLLIAGVLLCINPALKFPGAEKQLNNQKSKLTRLIDSIDKGTLENQKLSSELKIMPATLTLVTSGANFISPCPITLIVPIALLY